MSTAVVINLHARRGSTRLESTVRKWLPDARIAFTHSLAEARTFLSDVSEDPATDLLLSGGGDGTAVSLMNEWFATGAPMPKLGLIPLGTGNGWARATGSPPLTQAVRRIARHRGRKWPTQTFDLVDVEGVSSPFAGTGWDAEILGDYQALMRKLPRKAAPYVGGFPGYMASLFGRTVPRMVFRKRTNVRIINTGSPALAIAASGRAVPVIDGEAGSLLYEGPLSVCGCGTIEELGLGFRAFPFARAVPGRMTARVYFEPTLSAVRYTRKLWKGEHPLPNDHHFMLDACRMEFDQPVGFEIGGDVIGQRSQVDFRFAQRTVDLLDWRRLAAA